MGVPDYETSLRWRRAKDADENEKRTMEKKKMTMTRITMTEEEEACELSPTCASPEY
jgi:hypothetical protein